MHAVAELDLADQELRVVGVEFDRDIVEFQFALAGELESQQVVGGGAVQFDGTLAERFAGPGLYPGTILREACSISLKKSMKVLFLCSGWPLRSLSMIALNSSGFGAWPPWLFWQAV